MRVEEFLQASARFHGAKTALVAGDKRFTYAQFEAAAASLASSLAAGGIVRGDRVLVFMNNCWEAAVSLYAILKAGATAVPVNPSTKADKLAYMIGNCEAAGILTQGKLLSVLSEARRIAPRPLFVAATDIQRRRSR